MITLHSRRYVKHAMKAHLMPLIAWDSDESVNDATVVRQRSYFNWLQSSRRESLCQRLHT